MEYLEQRYNLPLQQTMTWVSLVLRVLDNMVRLYAIGVFIAVVTPLSLEWSIVVSGVIVTVFNLIGGIWTVTIMSTVQFIILILVTVILLPLSLTEAGGFAGIADKLPGHLDFFNGPKGNLFWLGIYAFMTLIKYNENWTFIQKFYCVRDEKAAMKVGVVTGLLFLVFTPVFLLPAVASPAIVPGIADPEMSYVSVAIKLLPVGIMGILFSSMFAATMSSLNAEYNVMASVLTNDIYKRLFNRNATEKKLLSVARISTALVGATMIAGAILIRNFGGAFEANKLFSSILAIPLGIPLLMGILVRKPDSTASIATIFTGVVSGIVLNLIPSVSWEMATLIESALCFIVYFIPSWKKRSEQKDAEVDSFFKLIHTPIRDEDKPKISPEYIRAIVWLFVFSLVTAGILFVVMSIPTINTDGGLYSCLAGAACLSGGLILAIIYLKRNKR
jgi:Na+/proline symporter